MDYPDGRSFTARLEHLDDYHFDMGGLGNVFHICQFAEVMERNLSLIHISQKNLWIDERGFVFVIFTICSLAEQLGRSTVSVSSCLLYTSSYSSGSPST